MNKILFIIISLALAGCGSGSSSSDSTVTNEPPVITSTAITDAVENTPYSYTVTATDMETYPKDFTWTFTTLPSWLNGEIASPTISRVEGSAPTTVMSVTSVDNGDVYAVVGVNSCNLERISPNGLSTRLFEDPSESALCHGLLAVGSKVYFSHTNNGEIWVLDTNNLAAGAELLSSKEDSGPVGLAEKDGFLYVGNVRSNSIDKIEIKNPSNRTVYANLSGRPYGLGFASNGDLYAALFDLGKVIRYDSKEGEVSIIENIETPTDVQFDRHDNMFVSNVIFDFSGSGKVGKIRKYAASTLDLTILADASSWDISINKDGVAFWGNGIGVQKLETLPPVLTGTPTRDNVGKHPVSVLLSDGTNEVKHDFTITVSAVNTLPTGTVSIAGELIKGQTLTASNTLQDTDGLGDISYQWYADDVAITGATFETFILTAAQIGAIITVKASYTDDYDFNEVVTSAASAAVADISNNLPTGTVSISGTFIKGQTLTASNTIQDADGLGGGVSYQWYASNVAITGATTETFTLTAAQIGATMTVKASYTDGAGFNEVVTSAATAAVADITNNLPTGSVTISGSAIKGQTLTATNTIQDADGVGEISHQWYADDVAIADATADTFILTAAQIGAIMTVKASYTDGAGFDEVVTSAATEAVANIANNLPTGTVTITGDLSEGSTLTASNDLDDSDGLGPISYQWYADGVAIDGATSATLVLSASLSGAVITVTAAYTDGEGFEESEVSAPSEAVTALLNTRTAAIAANGAIVALLQKDGSVQTWGDNTYGTMGYTPSTNGDTDTGSAYYNPNAATIAGLSGITSIAVGYRFVLALKDDGTVWAWGRNENGELGHEPGTNSDATISDDYGNFFGDYDGDFLEYYNPTPIQVAGLGTIVAISANYASAAALADDGTVWTWGGNSSGQLGDNGTSGAQSFAPVQVKDTAGTGTLTNVIAIFASDNGMFASQADGTLWAWGGNNAGQLGLGDNNDRLTPALHSLTNVIDVVMSAQLNAALKTDGTVFYWGDAVTTPTNRGLTGVAEITVAGNGAIATLANGSTLAWGGNTSGQLGNGAIDTIATPTEIFAADSFVEVAMGEFFTVALASDGTLKTWGSNNYGQLGHSPNANGDVQPNEGGDIYNLAGVTVDGISANSLAAPSAFSASFATSITVTWTDVENASSYNVYWSTTPDVNALNGTKIEGVVSGEALQSLASGELYHLMVTAVDAAGNESSGSLEVSVDTRP